tara:strand:- start:112 stop:393 length:282 start_codon:yes stop_codon:yes gene_type:complete
MKHCLMSDATYNGLDFSENVCCDFRIFWDKTSSCALYEGHETLDQDFRENDEEVFYSMVFQHQKFIQHYGVYGERLGSIQVMEHVPEVKEDEL